MAILQRKEIEGFAKKYDLVIPERQKASLVGEQTGKRTGSSIEYQDRRDYVPGDDIRYIDWRAYARSDRYSIKLFREEIAPRVDIIVDTSLSMSVTEEKSLRRMDLAYFFSLLGGKLHAQIGVYELGYRMQRLSSAFDLEKFGDREQKTPVPLLRQAPATRRGGIKIMISDFLFPFSPEELIGIFHNADRLILVQILSGFENNPDDAGPIRLEDAETPEHLDVSLDKSTINEYLKRLERLKQAVARCVRIAHGAFCTVTDEQSLDKTMTTLLQAGVIEV